MARFTREIHTYSDSRRQIAKEKKTAYEYEIKLTNRDNAEQIRERFRSTIYKYSVVIRTFIIAAAGERIVQKVLKLRIGVRTQKKREREESGRVERRE